MQFGPRPSLKTAVRSPAFSRRALDFLDLANFVEGLKPQQCSSTTAHRRASLSRLPVAGLSSPAKVYPQSE